MAEQTAVIVLAAGAGTRMRSRTPKVLHTLGGRSMLAHALFAAQAIEPDYLVAVVGHDRERVSSALDDLASKLRRKVHIAVQDEQHGTGHAVQCALKVLPPDFEGHILVTAADVPLLDGHTLGALLDEHRSYFGRGSENSQGAAVTVLTCIPGDPGGYGRIIRSDEGDVLAIVEDADATPEQATIIEVNTGVYAFDAAALRHAIERLQTNNVQHELYLTDVVSISVEAGRPVHGALLEDATKVSGVNDRVQLAHAARALNNFVLERHMRAGVTIVDPSTTWIDIDVEIGADTTLMPSVQLHGATRIGRDCTIGPDSTLTNVEVGQGARVIRTHADSSKIGDDTNVGPWAYLRPGTDLGRSGKIGAFVETKNAQIGAHSKVPHLTYVGDATIGEHSNIGASSVFVNYDGVNKSRTTIGSHVRTGSDTMLVAPVTVGDGAYTAAGTVVRKNVPPGALAVTTGVQRNLEGWVGRYRAGTPAARAAESALRALEDEKANEAELVSSPGNKSALRAMERAMEQEDGEDQ